MKAWLDDPQAQAAAYRLGWTLLHTLWIGAAVWGVFEVAMRALHGRAAQGRYLAGCAALALLMVVPVGVYWMVPAPATVAQGTITQRPQAVAESVLPEPAPAVMPVTEGTVTVATGAVRTEALVSPAQTVRPVRALEAGWAERVGKALEPYLPWVVGAWAVGVVMLSGWHLAGWTVARGLRRRARAVEPALAQTAARLGRQLGIRVRVQLRETVVVVGGVAGPAVMGWLRPVILLPLGFAAGLSPGQVEAILAHELAHIRRHDYLVNLGQAVVETLLFYHPCVWLISRRVRVEREHCCDDVVLAAGAERCAYAEGLVQMARGAGGMRLAVQASGAGVRLRQRVMRVLGMAERARTWPAAAGLVVLVVLAGVLANAAAPGQATTAPPQGQTQPATNGSGPTEPEGMPAYVDGGKSIVAVAAGSLWVYDVGNGQVQGYEMPAGLARGKMLGDQIWAHGNGGCQRFDWGTKKFLAGPAELAGAGDWIRNALAVTWEGRRSVLVPTIQGPDNSWGKHGYDVYSFPELKKVKTVETQGPVFALGDFWRLDLESKEAGKKAAVQVCDNQGTLAASWESTQVDKFMWADPYHQRWQLSRDRVVLMSASWAMDKGGGTGMGMHVVDLKTGKVLWSDGAMTAFTGYPLVTPDGGWAVKWRGELIRYPNANTDREGNVTNKMVLKYPFGQDQEAAAYSISPDGGSFVVVVEGGLKGSELLFVPMREGVTANEVKVVGLRKVAARVVIPPVELVKQIAAILPAGWTSAVKGDTLTVARTKGVSGYYAMPSMSAGEVGTRAPARPSMAYDMTLVFSPRISGEEYAAQVKRIGALEKEAEAMRKQLREMGVPPMKADFSPRNDREREMVAALEKLEREYGRLDWELPNLYTAASAVRLDDSVARGLIHFDLAEREECEGVKARIWNLFDGYRWSEKTNKVYHDLMGGLGRFGLELDYYGPERDLMPRVRLVTDKGRQKALEAGNFTQALITQDEAAWLIHRAAEGGLLDGLSDISLRDMSFPTDQRYVLQLVGGQGQWYGTFRWGKELATALDELDDHWTGETKSPDEAKSTVHEALAKIRNSIAVQEPAGGGGATTGTATTPVRAATTGAAMVEATTQGLPPKGGTPNAEAGVTPDELIGVDLGKVVAKLTKEVGGTWAIELNNGLPITERMVRGHVQAEGGKRLVAYDVFPFGLDTFQRRLGGSYRTANPEQMRVLGSTDSLTVWESRDFSQAEPGETAKVVKALGLKRVAAGAAPLVLHLVDEQGKALGGQALGVMPLAVGFGDLTGGPYAIDKEGTVTVGALEAGEHRFVVGAALPAPTLVKVDVPAKGLTQKVVVKSPEGPMPRPDMDVRVKVEQKDGKYTIAVSLSNNTDRPYTLRDTDLQLMNLNMRVFPAAGHGGAIVPAKGKGTLDVTLDWEEYQKKGLWTSRQSEAINEKWPATAAAGTEYYRVGVGNIYSLPLELPKLKTVGQLVEQLHKEAKEFPGEVERRRALVFAIGIVHTPAATRALLGLLTEKDDTIRSQAISSLTDRLGVAAEEGGSDEVLAALAKILPGEKDEGARVTVCARVVRVLMPIPPADKPEARLVAQAAEMLRERLKNDTSAEVRFFAACRLTEFGDNAGRAELEKAALALQAAGLKDLKRISAFDVLVPALERATGQRFGPVPPGGWAASSKLELGSAQALLEKIVAWIKANPTAKPAAMVPPMPRAIAA